MKQQHPGSRVSQNTVNKKLASQSSNLDKCIGCGGWGVGLVRVWGYCNHCTRVLNLPQSQSLSTVMDSKPAANAKDNYENKAPEPRSDGMMMMMSWIQWIQVLTPMLLVVAGLLG